MKRLRHVAARGLPILSVILVIAASGCGREATNGTGASGDEREEALLAVAQCMRDSGIDVPDPKPGERGFGFARPPAGSDPEKAEEARNACQSELEGTFGELAEDDFEWQDEFVDFARCMREKGIDMPDPDFSQPGSGPGEFIRQNSKPGDPEFDAADDVCREEVFGGKERGPGGGD